MNGNGARQSSSAESPAGDSGNGGSLGKRKADDGTAASVNGIAHTRAKRNRYISIAWYVLALDWGKMNTDGTATNASAGK